MDKVMLPGNTRVFFMDGVQAMRRAPVAMGGTPANDFMVNLKSVHQQCWPGELPYA